MWTTLGSEAILAVRTYAFLGKSPVLGVLLSAMLLGETGFLLYVAIAGVHQIDPIPIGDMKGPCTASDAPGKHVVSGFWLAPVAFDLICTFLTLWKASSIKDVWRTSRIVQIFIREGLGYFLLVAGVNVLNAAFMFQQNPNLQNINCFLALVLSQVLCCRLVLNLMGTSEAQTDLSTYTTSELAFASQNARYDGAATTIPLERYRGQTDTQLSHNDFYDSVKAQAYPVRHKDEFHTQGTTGWDLKPPLGPHAL